mgnify:FL=1
MSLTLLHSASAHCARFDAIRDRIAPGVSLTHEVRKAWLTAAQGGMSTALAEDIQAWVGAQSHPVLCTCTTIGAVAEAAGAVRIDRPLMDAAAKIGGPYVLAFCLDSTRGASEALLREAVGADAEIHLLPLTDHWALFEKGALSGFEAAMAASINEAAPSEGCVVLAQASMAGAAELLQDFPAPVLSSPELAMRAALDRL